MKDIYSMSRIDNVQYAKRCIVDTIYKQSRLEGIAVTFPETMEIYEGRSVAGLSVEDVIKVNNLKHAWEFVFDTIDYPMDLRYIRQINKEVGEGIVTDAGELRKSSVSIGGTDWKPDIPDYQTAEKEIQGIMESNRSVTDKAITMMLSLMRSQLFFDGNKRTAQIAANQIMIQGGAGILAIPVKDQSEFFSLLIRYYETNDMTEIKKFVYDTSIDGFTRNTKENEPTNRNMFEKELKIRGEDGKIQFVSRQELAMRILNGEDVQIIQNGSDAPETSQQDSLDWDEQER